MYYLDTAMQIVKDKISLQELKIMARNTFGHLVKAVVDVEAEIMAVDGELHSDEETLLLQQGCRQKNLWGINFYPEIKGDDWLEFDSMINLRPSENNFTRGIDNPQLKKRITQIVNRLVEK